MLNMDNAENNKPAAADQNTVLALRAALRASIHKQLAALNKAPSPEAARLIAESINDLCDAHDAIVPLFPNSGDPIDQTPVD